MSKSKNCGSWVTRSDLERMSAHLPLDAQAAIMAFYIHRQRAKKPWRSRAWDILIVQARRLGSPAFERRLNQRIVLGELSHPSSKRSDIAWFNGETEVPYD